MSELSDPVFTEREFFDARQGTKGRDGGPYLDEVDGSSTALVTKEKLVDLSHNDSPVLDTVRGVDHDVTVEPAAVLPVVVAGEQPPVDNSQEARRLAEKARTDAAVAAAAEADSESVSEVSD